LPIQHKCSAGPPTRELWVDICSTGTEYFDLTSNDKCTSQRYHHCYPTAARRKACNTHR
jgi:hypothetical protein